MNSSSNPPNPPDSAQLPTKKCRSCSEVKPENEFWKNNAVCIPCNKEKWKQRVTPEKRKQYADRSREFDDLNIQRYLLRYARKRAKAKGLECTIRPSDIELVDRCPILDVPLVKNRGQFQDNSYSLDRRDSSRGYVPGNVFVLSWKANSLKGNLDVEAVRRLLAYMEGNLTPSK